MKKKPEKDQTLARTEDLAPFGFVRDLNSGRTKWVRDGFPFMRVYPAVDAPEEGERDHLLVVGKYPHETVFRFRTWRGLVAAVRSRIAPEKRRVAA